MKIHIHRFAVILAFAALTLAGCAKKNETTEAIRQGVIRDLTGKFDMSKMDVVVDSVSFRDKEADATVTFMAKGATAGQGMTMKYLMERHDDGLWYIKGRSSATGAASSAAVHPSAAGDAGAAAATGSRSNLPAGHPDLGESQ